MSLQALIEQTPGWAKLTVAGAVAFGGWLGTIEFRLDSALSETEFLQYMEEYRLEQKRDFQRIEDKLDKKADKP